MSPDFEVRHARVVLAVVLFGIGHALAVMPHVGDGLGYRHVLAQALGIATGSPHGEILTVATAAGSPEERSAWSPQKLSYVGETHKSCANLHLAAVSAA